MSKPAGAKPSFPFYFDDDTFFSRSYRTIISQQENQQTIQIISFPGRKVLWTYGHVSVRGSSLGYLSTPDVGDQFEELDRASSQPVPAFSKSEFFRRTLPAGALVDC